MFLILLTIAAVVQPIAPEGQPSQWTRPPGMPRISNLEVMCGTSHMEVHLNFDSAFHGMVAAKGAGHGCVYVPPRTGQTEFKFTIHYDKCGTKPDNHGKFYENTIIIQYDEELIEAWDEAKRLRCEWFNDYEKTATKTNPMVISDLDVVELNFHGDNVDCWMEIQEGKGPWAGGLNGIVALGAPLTMVVAVKDPTGEFDMRVKQCEASDGLGGHSLPLSDVNGCILRPKLMGKFSKVKLDDGRATVLTYAHLSAFKFPDVLNVHLRCTVEICRHGCPDHCGLTHRMGENGIEERIVEGLTDASPRRLRRSAPSTISTFSTFRVLSENDLDFGPFGGNATTGEEPEILTGRMYSGVCLPKTPFALVFSLIGLATLVSCLSAGVLASLKRKSEEMVVMGKAW